MTKKATTEGETSAKETGIVTLDSLRSMAGVGMSHVDKSDIRPPQILLVQKSANLDEMVDVHGYKPSFGQFFDTGERRFFDEFDCYVVFAKKGTWINRRKPELGELDQYSMIGVRKDSGRIFGMLLRASARFALNGLFSSAVDQKLPMFAFNVHVESKKLSNTEGEWVVPVFRVGELETDPSQLSYLMKTAKQFDAHAEGLDLNEADESPSPTSSSFSQRTPSQDEPEASHAEEIDIPF